MEIEVAVLGRSRKALDLALDLSSKVNTTWFDLREKDPPPVQKFQIREDRIDPSALLIGSCISECGDAAAVVIVVEPKSVDEGIVAQILGFPRNSFRPRAVIVIIGQQLGDDVGLRRPVLTAVSSIEYAQADLQYEQERAKVCHKIYRTILRKTRQPDVIC